MATAGATRTYPTQVIPSDPTDANFEADFRSFTETLMTAIKDIDDEVSNARSGTSSFQSIDARFESIEATSGVAAAFWTEDTLASGSAGDTFFTTSQDQTAVYVEYRPIRVIGSAGTFYGYVQSSTYSSVNNETTVNLMTNTGSPFSLTGTFTSFSRATQDLNTLWLVSTAQLAPETVADLTASSLALTIALGG